MLLCEFMHLSHLWDFYSIRICRNDTFIILSRARGWWVVQRDPSGSGHLDPDQTKQGWVPAGCLLETSLPVAQAIADALSGRPGAESSIETPIMPSSIVSTSYPGVALMDYRKKGGEEELDVVKDDALRVFKRYNHWSYVCLTSPPLCYSTLIRCIRRSKKQTVNEAGCPAGSSGKSAGRTLHQTYHHKHLELHLHTPIYRLLLQQPRWNQPNCAVRSMDLVQAPFLLGLVPSSLPLNRQLLRFEHRLR